MWARQAVAGIKTHTEHLPNRIPGLKIPRQDKANSSLGAWPWVEASGHSLSVSLITDVKYLEIKWLAQGQSQGSRPGFDSV